MNVSQNDRTVLSLLKGGGNVRGFTIQPDTHCFQLRFQQCTLLSPFRGVENHQDQIARLRGGDHLSPSPFALRGTLDDTGKIQDLDLRTAILQHAGDGGQRGERVRRDFAPGLGDFGQECRLSDRWETHERHTGIAALADIKP